MRLALLALLILATGGAPAAWAAPAAPPPPPGQAPAPYTLPDAQAAPIATYAFPSGEAAARRVTLPLDTTPIAVWLPEGLDEAEAVSLLAPLTAYLGELPAAHRATLHTVAFDPGEYPSNARKAQQLKQPELKLWASARAGVIVFYRNSPPGDWRVTRRRVFHELGHCLAHVRFGTSTPPAEWSQAARSDDAYFTAYSRKAFEATGTLVEDFAEAYAMYMQALLDGEAPLTKFQATYPARAKLLARYTQGR